MRTFTFRSLPEAIFALMKCRWAACCSTSARWTTGFSSPKHTRGFEEYRTFLLGQDVNELCEIAGVAAEELYRVAKILQASKGFLSFYCMGLNQSTVGMWKKQQPDQSASIAWANRQAGAGPSR